jgi:hypothetical protein
LNELRGGTYCVYQARRKEEFKTRWDTERTLYGLRELTLMEADIRAAVEAEEGPFRAPPVSFEVTPWEMLTAKRKRRDYDDEERQRCRRKVDRVMEQAHEIVQRVQVDAALATGHRPHSFLSWDDATK